jgi:NAD(P)H dehydrogenase (quinone)
LRTPSTEIGDLSVPTIVTGASGHLGRLVAEELLERVPASELVLVTRHPEALDDLAARGAAVRRGDFDEPAGLVDALAGGERMLLISTSSVGRRVAQHRAAIEAAAAAGVRHIVYTSFPKPVPNHPVGPIATEHGETEAILHESAMAWTVLRNATFAELQVPPGALAVAGGKLYTNAGDGRLSSVSRRDCARVAAAVLTSDGHDGRTYDVTGPEALSQSELADLLAEVSGRPVELVPVGDRMLTWGLTRHGAPKPIARAIVAFGKAVREGYYDDVDSTVTTLTGQPPHSLRDVLIAHRGDLLAST